MRREHDATELRRYVLGALTEDERARIEDAYFERADVLDRVCAAEDDLIEDYLSDRLASDEHERFEEYYLATPRHRTRVGVVRALRSASPVSAPAKSERHERPASWWAAVRAWPSLGQLALVAALVLLVAGGVWMFRGGTDTPVSVRTLPPPVSPTKPPPELPDRRESAALPRPEPAPARTPVFLAVSLSPIHVRGSDEPARVTIVKGTDIVRLHLQRDADDQRLERGRAIVRTVAGREVWNEPTLEGVSSQPSVLASIDVPASVLSPDDYIVQLLETVPGTRGVERHRYFLRVRGEPPKNLP